jgi:hypothetical protein
MCVLLPPACSTWCATIFAAVGLLAESKVRGPHLRLYRLQPVFCGAICAVRLTVGAVRALQSLRGTAQTVNMAILLQGSGIITTQHVMRNMVCPALHAC